MNRVLLTLLLLFAATSDQVPAEESTLVQVRPGGLEYRAAANGDRIPDFSYCGYRGGGVLLPDVGTRITLQPQVSGDDTGRIQQALDQVASRQPDARGVRGAVLLSAGTYRVAGTLSIRHSGIVLRGVGSDADGTTIIATGTGRRALISIDGGRPGVAIEASRSAIRDERVPVGARTFRVTSPGLLSAGDPVVVFRPATAEWIRALGTDRLNQGPDDAVRNWEPSDYGLSYERQIVGVAGDAITIDAPIVCAIEERFGGGSICRLTPDERIHTVGVEGLRLVSEYREGEEESDEEHAWDAVRIDHLRDGWVRDVTALHFAYSCVNIESGAKRITVQDCVCLDPVSKLTGGRRYSFVLDGQLCLVQRCAARNGRHDYVMQSRACGPNVFLDCRAERTHSDSGPHHRWSTGTLYDNVTCRALNARWRGRMGSGHGWAGANMVFWNCRAETIVCERPPTANNYCIGCTGRIEGDGWIEFPGEPVRPRSLYLRQLEDRLGKGAVRNVTTPAQRAGSIDDVLRSN